ncbi:MAG: putative ABC transporter ATP-binding protein [Candidatus Xenobia bacterium]|jgi:energy-coupling factor transport system ATP-binding protein
MIVVRDLSFAYPGGHPVLQGIDLELAPGELVVLTGPNGCGKTTLARHLNGLLLPQQGTVQVDDLPTSQAEVRRLVGMVFQEPESQIVAPVVEEDVAFGLENLGLPREEMRRRVEWALERLDLTAVRRSEPHLLSGGQKQRLALASVLAMKPRYLVLDEPTTMLDPWSRREVLELLGDLRKTEGIAIILVTHRLEEALEADRVVVLANGRVRFQGSPAALFGQLELLTELGLELPDLVRLVVSLREQGFDPPMGEGQLTDWVLGQ